MGTFARSKDTKIFFFSSGVHLKIDGCSLSEIFKETAITDRIAETFLYDTFQRAKVLRTLTAKAPSNGEPYPCSMATEAVTLNASFSQVCSQSMVLQEKNNHIVGFKLLHKGV